MGRTLLQYGGEDHGRGRGGSDHTFLRVLLACVLLMPVAGCGIRGLRRAEVSPRTLGSVHQRNTTLKAHLHDGSMLVFSSWRLNEQRVVSGPARRLDWNRDAGPESEHSVAVDSVALFESDELTIPGPMAAITVVATIHATATAFCVAFPKACFGSCPTFYAWDGERQALVAEGFSASVAPALEDTDLDALDRVRPRAGRLTLTMTNEALETHVVRFADVLVTPRAAGRRVLARRDGEMWTTTDWRAPDVARCAADDCRELLAARDGAERTSIADSTDLAARETIELRFDHPPAGSLGLAVTARQSLLSTYIFYQTLAWMGRTAGTWLASLGRPDSEARVLATGPATILGGIDAQMEMSGEWVSAGGFHETGPLASDTRLIPLPTAPPGPLRVRLSLTRGLWRVDQVALVAVGERVEPLRVKPSRVLRHGVPDAEALACLTGQAGPLVTQPGDTLALEYELPATAEAPELFLMSRGYYMEWMRDRWIAEENAERLMHLFLTPGAALREMAPAYKKVEPEMERAFWGSRYAR